MKEKNKIDGLSIREILPGELEDFHQLPLKAKFRVLHFVVALALVMSIENDSFWITGCLTFNLLYSAFEARRIYEEMKSENVINYKLKMEENMMNNESLNGLFNGANLQDVQIVIAQSGSKVVYKQVTSTKGEIQQVTDEQIANAIRPINGEGKPLNGYQSWLGACCILSWKYGYPRNLKDCCKRVCSLPLEGVEYICKYENIRKFATYSFVKEDARLWSGYKPLESERTLFNECLSVAQALDIEIQKQLEAE